ncbi:MAG: septal ring lytic transglycosylase RlpA family protein [Bacteroidales bacterium]
MRLSIVILTLLILLLPIANAQQYGKVSYYSNSLKGRRVSNGERYNPNAFTAAHRTYNFGTILKVTSLKNGEIVVVRVTDRGPFIRGRIIDISYCAAKKIGLIATGFANVEVVEDEELRYLIFPEPLFRLEIPTAVLDEATLVSPILIK